MKCEHEIYIGQPNDICAGCRKPLDQSKTTRQSIRIAYPRLSIPFYFQYQICTDCLHACKAGGARRDSVLAAVNAFHEGEEANQ
jgi:hypothetical protein